MTFHSFLEEASFYETIFHDILVMVKYNEAINTVRIKNAFYRI